MFGFCAVCAVRSLIGRGLGDLGDAEGGYVSDTVVVSFFDFFVVYYIFDVRDGEGCFGYIGGYDI